MCENPPTVELFFLEKTTTKTKNPQELSDILSKQYDVPSCVFSQRMSSVSGLSNQSMKKNQTKKISSFSNVSSKLCLGLSSDEIPFSNTNQIHTQKKINLSRITKFISLLKTKQFSQLTQKWFLPTIILECKFFEIFFTWTCCWTSKSVKPMFLWKSFESFQWSSPVNSLQQQQQLLCLPISNVLKCSSEIVLVKIEFHFMFQQKRRFQCSCHEWMNVHLQQQIFVWQSVNSLEFVSQKVVKQFVWVELLMVLLLLLMSSLLSLCCLQWLSLWLFEWVFDCPKQVMEHILVATFQSQAIFLLLLWFFFVLLSMFCSATQQWTIVLNQFFLEQVPLNKVNTSSTNSCNTWCKNKHINWKNTHVVHSVMLCWKLYSVPFWESLMLMICDLCIFFTGSENITCIALFSPVFSFSIWKSLLL